MYELNTEGGAGVNSPLASIFWLYSPRHVKKFNSLIQF